MHSADLVRLFHSTIMENIKDIASKIVDNDMLDGWSQLRDCPLEISGEALAAYIQIWLSNSMQEICS